MVRSVPNKVVGGSKAMLQCYIAEHQYGTAIVSSDHLSIKKRTLSNADYCGDPFKYLVC